MSQHLCEFFTAGVALCRRQYRKIEVIISDFVFVARQRPEITNGFFPG
jgi:hypothetical protein